MQLARRGGHRSGRKLKPEEVDGYIQAIRDSMMICDTGKKIPPAVVVKAPPPTPKASTKEVKMANLPGEVDKKDKRPIKNADSTKWIWKPKARASGDRIVDSLPSLLDQGIVHKFGSEKRCSSTEAARLAIERAKVTQAEVGSSESELTAGGEDSHLDLALVDFLKNAAEGILSRDKELLPNRRGSVLWDKSVLPLDFSMTDFSDLEEQTRRLYQLDDEWAYQDDANPILESSPVNLRPREEQVQQWWGAYQPEMADRIIPFVRNAMANNPDPLIGLDEACIMALDHLSEGGARIDQVCAKTALEVFKTKMLGRIGKERAIPVSFPPLMKCADYMVQNVSVGALHFSAVDMGEDVALTFKMQQALGSETNKELNQCIAKHLALALKWWVNGRRFNVPTRSRADAIASELRTGEFTEAQSCMGHIKNRRLRVNMSCGRLYTMLCRLGMAVVSRGWAGYSNRTVRRHWICAFGYLIMKNVNRNNLSRFINTAWEKKRRCRTQG